MAATRLASVNGAGPVLGEPDGRLPMAQRLEDAIWRAVWDVLPSNMPANQAAAVAGAAQSAASAELRRILGL